MAFVLAGLVLRGAGHPTVPLPQGFGLMTLPAGPDEPVVAGLSRLTEAGWETAVALSSEARVAYIEAEFWAGDGTQAAIGWLRGRVAFGPRLTQTPGEDEPGYETVQPPGDMAINDALRWLGVRRSDDQDEFDTLRLGDLR